MRRSYSICRGVASSDFIITFMMLACKQEGSINKQKDNGLIITG